MAYKVFTNGSVLNASEVNDNLMNQAVITFSNSAARASAITSPIEGQLTWLEDVNRYEFYNGTAWVPLIPESQGNAIINGAFDIWQRGTSFTTTSAYTADRWQMIKGASGSAVVSQQAFTPGAAPEAGYESAYFLRYASTNANDPRILQNIEDVRTFAGQTVTLSFWAKSNISDAFSGTGITLQQNFGSGGSSAEFTSVAGPTLTSDWERYSFTLSVPSISGKTIGANSNLRVQLSFKASDTFNVDIWGVQLEAGPVATPFRRNANSIQGELAACQRYYYYAAGGTFWANGSVLSTTQADFILQFPVSMRIAPTALEQNGTAGSYSIRTGNTNTTCSAVPSFNGGSVDGATFKFTVASGLTIGQAAIARNISGYLAWSAEL